MSTNKGVTASTDNTENLPAITGESLPAAPLELTELEFSDDELTELFAAIKIVEQIDVTKCDKVRVDATYREFSEKGEKIVRMVSGYKWEKSTFPPYGDVPCITLYDRDEKCFERVMQTALTGKIIEMRIPKGTLVEIEYLDKVKGGNGFTYQDFAVRAFIAKAEPAPVVVAEKPAAK